MSRKLKIFLIVIVAVSAIAVLVPKFVQPDTTAAQRALMNNLRQIEGAKGQWTNERPQVSSTNKEPEH